MYIYFSAVPTKNLKINDTPSIQNILRQNHANKRHNAKLVQSLIQTSSIVDVIPLEETSSFLIKRNTKNYLMITTN